MNQFNEPWRVSHEKILVLEDASTCRLMLSVEQIESLYPADNHLIRHGEERCQTEKLLHRIVACVNALAGVPTEAIQFIVNLGKDAAKSLPSGRAAPGYDDLPPLVTQILADSPEDSK